MRVIDLHIEPGDQQVDLRFTLGCVLIKTFTGEE
jgi:hypothetical protein